MPNEEPRKDDEPKPQTDTSAPASSDPKELADDDLKAVSGGLMSTHGTTVPSSDTAVCVSQLA